MLCEVNSELGEVDIRQVIFRGDSLSPSVFVLALIKFDFKKGQGSMSFQEAKRRFYLWMI